MIHNDVAYWRHLQSLSKGDPDLPSPRVCRLLERTFARWHHKPLWLSEHQVGHLFRDRPDLPETKRRELAALPIAVRKGLAIARMLEIVTDPEVARLAGTTQVDADDLMAGTLPPFSVGQGKEFVRYLTEDEELRGMLSFLNELSPMGHIVPDHGRVVQSGLKIIIDHCRGSAAAGGQSKAFYDSVVVSLEGVIAYALRYADRVDEAIARLEKDDPRRNTLHEIAARLRRVPAEGAKTFADALQAILIVHCALHWTVEVVPLGRLDQILFPFYERDLRSGVLTRPQAQELIDAFWIKLDERVILNYRHAENRFTAADGVLTGSFGASNYDQGGLLNQWMQQITIGGVLPNDAEEPADACNEVTELCLEASRRLPLNSPTLDLRVHRKTPRRILEMAARALMSGGAHPVLLCDERIVPGLSEHAGKPVPLRTARNYACDGCYETMFAGETEFSFGFVPALMVVEQTLNRGAGLAGAGPMNLRGDKLSWRTPDAQDLKTWDELWRVLVNHILLSCHRYLSSLLTNYGNKEGIAPSPLLSALISGCIERGRDLVAGGANYRIFSPLMTGISSATDSLFAIKTLAYDQQAFTLDELVTCLATDWGSKLIGPEGQKQPAFGAYVAPARINEIRAMCQALPKFGFGNRAVDEIGWRLINAFCDSVQIAWQHPVHRDALELLKKRYGEDFDILLAPGVGTFEQYVLAGMFAGASADGRSAGDAVASDLSPAPVPDRDPVQVNGGHIREGSVSDSFKSFAHSAIDRLGDGAPTDYNLPEDFPVDRLTDLVAAFARGEGGSIVTFTVADPATFLAAQQRPADFNLLRVRMGGWSEFFVALFPDHQSQHRRRPLFRT